MEALAGKNFEKLATAEATIKSLQTQNSSLLDRLDDLENLWIMNIAEGSENVQDPMEFISMLLREGMGVDVFQKPPKLERAHRTLGPRP